VRRFDGYLTLAPGALRDPVVAIGNFDGVHRGHQELLRVAHQRAHARGGEAAVLTFDPHPAKVLAPALAPPLLCTLARRLELFSTCGIDATVVEPFTPELAALAAPDFVSRVLVDGLGAREVVVGYDFTYGRKRQGTVDTLRAAGAAAGFALHVVAPVSVDGIVASSTKIREFLHEGNVAGARLLLGRDFDADGQVVAGAGRGRGLGVPTANVAAVGELLPRPGVYAGLVSFRDGPGADVPRPAAINLGRSPTFTPEGALGLEAHILDWDGDLYGRTVRVAFRAWLRREEKFPGVEALLAQIRKDIDNVRQLFQNR
jgi:riboflavin kinase / FMN adenylyltransferase